MTEQSKTTPRVDGHLRFLNATGTTKTLSAYTLEVLDSRARRGLQRWFLLTPQEAVLMNPDGLSSAEEVREDLEDLLAVLRLDDTHAEGWIDVIPNGCESITYTVSGSNIEVSHRSC